MQRFQHFHYVAASGRWSARPVIELLMALQPETALRKRTDGRVEEVPAAELAFGDVVVLRPGARVLTDGVIMIGRGGRTSVHSQYAYHQFPICRCRWFGMAMEP